jgi:hypothetical protein
MFRKPRATLKDTDEKRNWAWIRSLGGNPPPQTFQEAWDEAVDPGRKLLSTLSDEALSAIIAREPNSKQGHLAASIMRTRESWRTPARPALIISVIALTVSLVAIGMDVF